MPGTVLHIANLVKCYDEVCAVDNLSCDIFEGEVFGLLGPNGAGKTSTIRMVMDIFRADKGVIEIFGKRPDQVREWIGYLPEERGLYPKRVVKDTLVYLAQLKGVPRSQARVNADHWLDRIGLHDWARHRIQDLSRGMQQRLQFAAACVHSPKLLILDEPFQGLDPVNVEVLRNVIRELSKEGTTIVLSAHEMNRVEELCDNIAIINHGRTVLYGALNEIQTQYGTHLVRLRTPDELAPLPGIVVKEHLGKEWTFDIDNADPQTLLQTLVARGVNVELFEVGTAPLEQIFINVVTKDQANEVLDHRAQ